MRTAPGERGRHTRCLGDVQRELGGNLHAVARHHHHVAMMKIAYYSDEMVKLDCYYFPTYFETQTLPCASFLALHNTRHTRVLSGFFFLRCSIIVCGGESKDMMRDMRLPLTLKKNYGSRLQKNLIFLEGLT